LAILTQITAINVEKRIITFQENRHFVRRKWTNIAENGYYNIDPKHLFFELALKKEKVPIFLFLCRLVTHRLIGLPDGLFSNQKSQFGLI
jgi:hypothetical protein